MPNYYTKSAFKVAFTCPRQLQLGDDKATSALEQALLRYCHLDTLAMVRIWEKLSSL
jgi:hypothetical protein